MNKKKAFTIAEIVVAMMVLGTIAMVLMPVLYNDTEERVTDAALNKTYSTFQQTARSIGLLISTGKIAPSSTPTFTFFQALTETSKTINVMDLSDVDSNIDVRGDADNAKANMDVYLEDYNPDKKVTGITPGYANTVILKNGVFVMLDIRAADEYIVIDVNGKKKPNEVGRDIFYFTVNKADSSSYSIKPASGGSCDINSDDFNDRLGCTRQRLKIKL
ncbi:MAG: type II secretion system GspH family protein [bacterium]|nr:type II secretion system GspH family protein [bacterium]